MVRPSPSHYNSKLDVFTSGSTWKGAQICAGYIHLSNAQHRVHRASSFSQKWKQKQMLPLQAKNWCQPPPVLESSEEGGLRRSLELETWRAVLPVFAALSKMPKSHIWHNHGCAHPSAAQQRAGIPGAVLQRWSHRLNSPSWCLRSLHLLCHHLITHAVLLGNVTRFKASNKYCKSENWGRKSPAVTS